MPDTSQSMSCIDVTNSAMRRPRAARGCQQFDPGDRHQALRPGGRGNRAAGLPGDQLWIKPMTTELKPRAQQTGAYLLEALIGILIFALGVLGIVGLQAASLRTTTDSSLRAEAVFAATQLIGQMWADKYVNLAGNYCSATAGSHVCRLGGRSQGRAGRRLVPGPDGRFRQCHWQLQSGTDAVQQHRIHPDLLAIADGNGVAPTAWHATGTRPAAVVGQNVNT